MAIMHSYYLCKKNLDRTTQSQPQKGKRNSPANRNNFDVGANEESATEESIIQSFDYDARRSKMGL